ncbi:MAG: hypothetical protein CL587_08215 [Alteromonadaceae bacterium]|nr:hypothetical protein [Alteromonadaceae bacterium]
MTNIILSCGISALSLVLLYVSWQKQHRVWLWFSLLAFAGSFFIWSRATGWETGSVFALCLPAIGVWPLILANRQTLPAPKNQPVPKPLSFVRREVLQHAGHYLVILIVLLVVSLLSSLAVSLALPMKETGQLASCIVLLPVIWGLLGYHYFAVASKPKALALYTVLGALSAVYLLFIPAFQAVSV